jgi:Na+/H+-translocating membrane pyrophosphatase
MNRISAQIQRGAMTFLRTEYTYLLYYVLVVFIVYILLYTVYDPPSGSRLDGLRFGGSFVFGALLSAISGYAGVSLNLVLRLRTVSSK